MKQKLFLTASLLSDPSNWILDEPMVGLDPEAAFNLKEIMRQRAAAGKTVFFSTHVMEVAEKLCTRFGIINRGRIIFTGTADDLRAGRGFTEMGDVVRSDSGTDSSDSAHTAGSANSAERTAQNVRSDSGADSSAGTVRRTRTNGESLEQIFLDIIRADNEQRGQKDAPQSDGARTASGADSAASANQAVRSVSDTDSVSGGR
jgi:ABC-type multidrug transport system ATPase subunit